MALWPVRLPRGGQRADLRLLRLSGGAGLVRAEYKLHPHRRNHYRAVRRINDGPTADPYRRLLGGASLWVAGWHPGGAAGIG